MDSRNAVKAVFEDLLEEKRYNEISVAEICKRAGISNKTFYKHFEGKPALVQAIVDDDLVAPVIKVREVLPLDAIKSATLLMTESTYATLDRHRAVYKNLIRHFGREELGRAIVGALLPLNESLYQKYSFSPEETQFAAYFFAATQVNILVWWFDGHEDIPAKQVAYLHYKWAYAYWREMLGEQECDNGLS